jgi:hypothetical protein
MAEKGANRYPKLITSYAGRSALAPALPVTGDLWRSVLCAFGLRLGHCRLK